MAGLRLLLWLALALWLVPPAGAQQRPSPDIPVQIYADEITYDTELGIVFATGHVEISQGDRVLTADTVTYNERANLVAANGNVVLKEPTGETVFGDYVEMTGDMKEGAIRNLRMLLADQARLAAASGQRSQGNRTVLSRGVYSPCDLCKEKPGRAPLWQVKAREIEHDQAAQEVYYRDAWLEIAGIPVFYTPYLQHPDPTVKRRSGLLAPDFGTSDTLGPTVLIPYYWVTSPHSDVTLQPMYTEKGGTVLGGEYRQRFSAGDMAFSASVVNAPKVDSSNNEIPGHEIRGHIKGNGRFDYDENWRWGFDLARSTDDTYLSRYRMFRRYGFPSTTTLTSRGFAEGFYGSDYAALNAYAFQGLRAFDDPGQSPLVLPFLEYSRVGEPGFLGGRLNFDANALSILRTEGTDTRRLSLRSGWSLPYTAPAGDIYSFQLQLQSDLYHVNNLSASDPSATSDDDGFFARAMPTAGLTWRFPFVRNSGDYQQFLEPTAAVFISPNGGNDRRIPNEDSRAFELDYTNLFRINRIGGFDRVEGGQRVVYGLNAGMTDIYGRSISGFIGHSYRRKTDDLLVAGSGIEDEGSDIVGRLSIVPFANASLNYTFRADSSDFGMVRSLAGFSIGPPALRLDGVYQLVDRSAQPQFTDDLEQIGLQLSTRFTEHWSAQIANLRNLDADEGDLRWSASLVYSDECLIAGLYFVRNFVGDRDNPPDSAVFLRLVFRTLGEFAPNLF